MPTAVDPALIPTARFEGSRIGTALLSYANIANFSHNYKGKALAVGLTHAKIRSLTYAGGGSSHSPYEWTTGLKPAQRQSRFTIGERPFTARSA